MKNELNRDEMAVVAIYWAEYPKETIKKIIDVIPFIDDADMLDVAQSAIQKVAKMNEEEYKRTKENLKYLGVDQDE